MKLRNDTANIQEALGAYCRTGNTLANIPGLTANRVKHYRRLVYNVVKGTMDQAYPITRAALGEDLWDRLVDDFFANHRAEAPQLWKLPYAFYQYHSEHGTGESMDRPYLNDLLYFEWAEIEIHTMPDIQAEAVTGQGDFLEDRLVVNPEHEILQLEYPVHKMPAHSLAANKGQYLVLLFREPGTGKVRFMEITPVHAYILLHVNETSAPVATFKGEIARMAGIESETYLDQTLTSFLVSLTRNQMILGFAKQP